MQAVLQITEQGAPPETAGPWLQQQLEALKQSAGYAGYALSVECSGDAVERAPVPRPDVVGDGDEVPRAGAAPSDTTGSTDFGSSHLDVGRGSGPGEDGAC